MKHLINMILLLCILVISTPTAAKTAKSKYTPAKCQFTIPKGMAISCGFLTVPEDRSKAEGKQIQLAIAIARGAGKRAADPVLYLAGGPGSPAVRSTAGLASGWAGFLGNHDLIVIDQRGVGFSKPALTCPEVESFTFDSLKHSYAPGERASQEASALLACQQRLSKQGITLAAYTTEASAHDLEDLRIALGYKQWNIFGISYGTRLGLEYLRAYPGSIRSLVLDSVYPPQANLLTTIPANLNTALRRLFDGCAADPRCQQAYPTLESDFDALLNQLDKQPVHVNVSDPRNKKRIDEEINGGRLVEIIFRTLYTTTSIPRVPYVIAAARDGNFRPLAELETARLSRTLGSSHALYYAVQCASDISRYNNAEADTAARSYPRLERYARNLMELTPDVRQICSAWGSTKEPDRMQAAVSSAIPSLLLTGEFDPITPAGWADLAATTLSKSTVYHFPGTGHAVITRGTCPVSIMRAFLSNPNAAIKATCPSKAGSPEWVLP